MEERKDDKKIKVALSFQTCSVGRFHSNIDLLVALLYVVDFFSTIQGFAYSVVDLS